MRLTKREKALLLIMLFAIAGFFLYRYIIPRQLEGISASKKDLAEWKAQKQELSTIDQTIQQLSTEKNNTSAEIQTIGNQYFSSLDQQEDSIIVINELILGTGCGDISVTFDELKSEKVKGNDSKAASPTVQNARLRFSGTYDNIWSLIRRIWNFQKCIMITDITISCENMDLPDLLTCDVGLSLYDLSKMTQVNDEIVQWGDSGTYRKANPFSTISNEAYQGTRYVLNAGYSDTNIYVKFADITGHWAEAAIDDFGNRHLITGDEENRFNPDISITRGEFVILLDKYFDWETPGDPVDLTGFSDYSELGQSLDAMEKAFYKGYLKNYFVGYGDGTLRPNAPTSYTEFQLVMGRILEQSDYSWDATAAEILNKTGYHSPGIEDKNAYISRAEVVYFLYSLSP